MKKSLLKLLFVPFLLASCSLFGGGDEDESTLDPNSAEGKKRLTIRFHVDAKSTEAAGYKKVIDAFNTDHAKDDIKVTAAFVARTSGDSAYERQLATDLMDGTLPDIVTFDAPNCAAYAKAGYLYDISSALSAEEKGKYLTLNTYQGKLYGIPIQESSAGFYYNKALFEGIDVSGYTVDNPWTFDQFKAVCGQLKAKGVTPVDMRLDANKDETATYLLYPFIYAAGGSFVDETGLIANGYFNSAGSKKGFSFIKELVTLGYTGYGSGASDFFAQTEGKKVGMYLSSGWTIPDLDNKYPAVYGNHDRSKWGLLPYPKDVQAASATGSWSFAVTNNKREDKTLVIELLKYLTNATSSKTITDHTGMIPANKDVQTNYGAGSAESVLYEQLQKTGKPRPVTVGYPQFSAAFSQVISGLRDNDVSTLVDNKASVLQGNLDKLK